MKDPGAQGPKLRITYFGGDKDRTFNIFINNTPLKTVRLDGSAGDKFFDVDCDLRENLIKSSPG